MNTLWLYVSKYVVYVNIGILVLSVGIIYFVLKYKQEDQSAKGRLIYIGLVSFATIFLFLLGLAIFDLMFFGYKH